MTVEEPNNTCRRLIRFIGTILLQNVIIVHAKCVRLVKNAGRFASGGDIAIAKANNIIVV